MNARAAWTCLLIAAGIAGTSGFAAAGPWSLKPGEYYSALNAELFSSTSAYDQNSHREALDRRLDHRTFTSTNEFGWKKRMSVLLSMTALSATSFHGGTGIEETETGLTELQLGLHYNLVNGAQGAAIEAGWFAPLGYDRVLSPLLGDGRQRLYGRLDWGTSLGTRAFGLASAGWTYRYRKFGSGDSSFTANPLNSSASFVTLGASGGWWAGRSLLIGARYEGRQVIASNGDKDTEEGASLHQVGPVVVVRVDDRLDVLAGSMSTAAGKNSLHFDSYYVAIAFKQTSLTRLQGFMGNSKP
jgi:hypothetical protein